MSMSSVEVALMASNDKSETTPERYIPRPHRPPPPPPTQSQPPNPPRIGQKIIPPESMIIIIYNLYLFFFLVEISPPSAETSTEPVDDLEENRSSLL
jgi:hypothetical protein